MSASRWLAQQREFAGALLDPQRPAPPFLRTRDGAALSARLDVYRNNVHAGLIEALLATFPVTVRLVSEESFRALAREYLRRELPREAALHEYGAGLPSFLNSLADADSPAFLPDVAALEHAWWQSYGAADAPVLDAAALAGLAGGQLLRKCARIHPAMRLVASAHPVLGIWTAHQGAAEPQPPADWQAEHVLITRPDTRVQMICISPAGHAFLDALASGEPLESAAGAALAQDPAFDLGTTLLRTVHAGAIQELVT